MLSHAYDYRSTPGDVGEGQLEARGGHRRPDARLLRPFLPESLAGLKAIRCLSPEEKLKLNQIRGFTYLYLFGLVEEYIVPSVVDHVRRGVRGDG